MNTYQKETLHLCLKNNITKLSFQIILSRLLNLIFIFYFFFVFYLLVFDTSYIVSINLYENNYIAIAVCVLATIIGMLIFVASQWNSFLAKIKLYSTFEKIDIPKFSFSLIFKRFIIRTIIAFLKTGTIIMFLFPSAVLFLSIIKMLNDGLSVYVLTVVFIGCVFLAFLCLFSSVCINQRYLMCDYCLCVNRKLSVIKIIKMSAYLMNGRCGKVVKYNSAHLMASVFGLIIPLFTVIQNSSVFIIATDKIIPYVQRYAHTEKPLVFYFNKKANVQS